MCKKRVVVVDDSAVIRALVRRHLTEDGRFIVVGEAGDPFEAREVIKRVNPDVITLDVEMPRMDGLSFLEKLMRLRPLPVVMFSTETHKGSIAAIEALSLGAVDCIGKPNAAAPDTIESLAERVFIASNARIPSRQTSTAPPPSSYSWNGKYVLVGASTGGVDALERLLAGYPADCPPTVIAQHMPESFLVSFAERLSNRVRPDVTLARDGERLQAGMVRIAPGGANHLVLSESRKDITCRLRPGEKVSGHRPSVDMLFRSARPFASRVLAVLLTGMGRDGAYGMLELRQAGAQTIAQDRDSSVVYGMPRVATEIGGANRTLDLDRIAAGILEETGRGASAAPNARAAAK
ncbi:protein-glutamate methylesterase/protein-glutamine glutaminase [Aliiruegeria lutimaris]|uniref:Protein-glutamate methylesterase/protein-glutamine glutaminase n=1 Tax=Aliiruegeria lutimaris TaxID=571298 RepID=A0A1G9EFS5_9RHOB|nr:chemotaxis response regulator protein-glutamate methylesterase [Aliiruegeria lutimaris]SDK74913.1 two-component system, chemotaxis family, response regulator CheB [Aliiruegeria lutimaris]